MMQITLLFQLTPKEIRRALRSHRELVSPRRGCGWSLARFFLFYVWMMFAGGAMALLVFGVGQMNAQAPAPNSLSERRLHIFSLCAVLVALTTWWFFRFTVRALERRKALRHAPWLARPLQITVDADRLLLEDQQDRIEWPWREFVRFGETTDLFLIFTTQAHWVAIPQRGFDTLEQAAAFRLLLNQKVHPRTGGLPIAEPADDSPDPEHLKLAFELTPQELYEYGGVIARFGSPTRKFLQLLGVFALISSLYALLLLIVWSIARGTVDARIGTALACTAIASLMSWRLTARAGRSPAPPPQMRGSFTEPNPVTRAHLMALVFAIFPVAIFGLLAKLIIRTSGDEKVSAAWNSLRERGFEEPTLQYLPLGILLGTCFTFAAILQARVKRRPRRPLILELSDRGFVLDGPRPRSEHRWSDVTNYVESPNLFILYRANEAVVIPKRLLTLEGHWSLDRFRAILHQTPGS